jgi:methylase of polypeptide subunit release factors
MPTPAKTLTDVQRILGRQYHAVVGNPPYIVVQGTRHSTRPTESAYVSCHRKYSLGAPFTERFFELALTGSERELRRLCRD